ncbi:MAG: ABC transporter ATP-binding protein [Alcaligenaceae bacterium]|nr:ABC transporter ATP-binding protein [Alcaligenaceae bacterium]
MSANKSILKTQNLTKHYGSKVAIENVSLEIKAGEIFGFLGPNGAGKSTTIRTILGFIKPTSGSICVLGETDIKKRRANHRHIGYLAGDIALYETMTGRNILKYITKLGYNTDTSYIDELVTGFDANLDTPIKKLSKGNRQKIGLIQALMHKPKLIILDEPTTGLDPLMKERLYQCLQDAAARGAGVFFSSHDLSEVQKICHRAGFIRQGKLITIEEIHAENQLAVHYYTATFSQIPPLDGFKTLPSVEHIKVDGQQVTFTVRGHITEFMTELAQHKPLTFSQQELELEEMFMHYYQSGDAS